MIFRWIRSLFQKPYQASGDGPDCPLCGNATELVSNVSYQQKCFCRRCLRHYILEK